MLKLGRRETVAPARAGDLVTVAQPNSPAAEAYRTLRTNIQFASLDRPVRSLLVTSSAADEGKTTILANLAVTFAHAGTRTLLVDCDLRRPALHTLFGVDNALGFTSLVLESGFDRPPIRPTEVENLSILPSGPLPPNPADFLGSARVERTLAALQTEADMLLFDAPPAIAVTDAAMLARRVDGVLLVVSAGRTKREHALKAKANLEKVGANLLGVVLNGVKLDSNLYYGG